MTGSAATPTTPNSRPSSKARETKLLRKRIVALMDTAFYATSNNDVEAAMRYHENGDILERTNKAGTIPRKVFDTSERDYEYSPQPNGEWNKSMIMTGRDCSGSPVVSA